MLILKISVLFAFSPSAHATFRTHPLTHDGQPHRLPPSAHPPHWTVLALLTAPQPPGGCGPSPLFTFVYLSETFITHSPSPIQRSPGASLHSAAERLPVSAKDPPDLTMGGAPSSHPPTSRHPTFHPPFPHRLPSRPAQTDDAHPVAASPHPRSPDPRPSLIPSYIYMR
jgi:hypothetical protein